MIQFDDVRPVSRHLLKFYKDNKDIFKESELLVKLNCDGSTDPLVVANEKQSCSDFNNLINNDLENPILRLKKGLSGLEKDSDKDDASLFDFSSPKNITVKPHEDVPMNRPRVHRLDDFEKGIEIFNEKDGESNENLLGYESKKHTLSEIK